MSVVIQTAGTCHLAQIGSVARAYQLREPDGAAAGDRGFLVSGFTLDDYAALLGRADHFYVSVDGQAVLGFLLAYSSDRIADDEWLNQQIIEQHPGPFVVIKQICVRPDATGRGIATALYEHLFDRAADLPCFAAIVLDPPNTRSIAFHEKLGFRKALELTPPDGLPRGVWKRRP